MIDDVLRRLRGIDRQSLAFDRERAEAALARHFAAVKLDCPSIFWVHDVEEGSRRTLSPILACGKNVMAWREAELTALKGVGRLVVDSLWGDAAEVDRGSSIDPIRDSLRDAAWSPLESLVLAQGRSWGLAMFDFNPRWRHARSAALCGSLAAAWRPAMRKHIPVWEPFLDASDAGLWVFWVTEEGIVAVPRPVIRSFQGRLHAESGPAVEWPSGSRWWFWRGVRVPRRVIEDPASITLASISDEQNLEVRRILIERYGHERFLADLSAHPVGSDDFGTLYRVEFADDEPLALVKVVNSTPEPDGSRKDYFLRVPPRVQTAREAVAWTFGVSPDTYKPVVQT